MTLTQRPPRGATTTGQADSGLSPTQGDVSGLVDSYVGGIGDKTTVLGVATYADRDAAVADFRTLLRSHQIGEGNHVAAAILVKGSDGKLHLDHHDTTAADLEWGGALVGGALAVVAAPLAIAPLSVAATRNTTWAGAGGIVGYFWHNIPKGQLLRMSDLAESGQAALVVVVLDHTATDIEALLGSATEVIVAESDGGDIELAFEEAMAREQPLS